MYNFFYNLILYADENWRGGLSKKEILERTREYTLAFKNKGNTTIIQELVEQLDADGSNEALDFLRVLA